MGISKTYDSQNAGYTVYCMIRVKKAAKYSKYFLLLALASAVSLVWPNKDTSSNVMPGIPEVHAEAPSVGDDGDDGDDGGGDGGGDCDDGGDCD